MVGFFVVGVAVALFVGFNVGGSTTGPAFGPAIGARAISKITAAALMSVFFFIGAWTIGRRVVVTLGVDLITQQGIFTIESSIVVLFFIGGALFVGNYYGIPASTSMTAVGAIAGLGLATGTLNWAVMGGIAVWWIVAPIIGFWVSAIIGRYFYPWLNQWLAITTSPGPLLTYEWDGRVLRVKRGPNTSVREVLGIVIVVIIGCLMAFSSGTSNIANAIAPLVGAGMDMNTMIILGCLAVSLGAFTIARRTLETLGNDITELPLTAAILVAMVSSTIVIGLSVIGIPASFVIIATTSIIGLGWGRATRSATIPQVVRREETPSVTIGALAADDPGEAPLRIGDENSRDLPAASDLFDPATTGRVIMMQNIVPILSTVGAFLTFELLYWAWW